MANTSTENDATVGPRTKSAMALLLRFGLGFPLLNAGLSGFWMNQAGMGGGFMQTPFGRPVPSTELTGVFQFLPYLEIIVALAILLGFFTTLAALVGAFLGLVPAVLQTISLLTTGFLGGRGGPFGDYSMFQALSQGGVSGNLLLSIGLVWLASLGFNHWSLDALIFGPKRAVVPAPGVKGPSADPEFKS